MENIDIQMVQIGIISLKPDDILVIKLGENVPLNHAKGICQGVWDLLRKSHKNNGLLVVAHDIEIFKIEKDSAEVSDIKKN